jgi:hypothetical protein
MKTLVYATDTARRYHASRSCLALRNAQDLSDWDCWDDYCRHDHPMPRVVREIAQREAVDAGKWPCHTCYPTGIQFPIIPPSSDSFGHEPFEYDGVPICHRCAIQHRSFLEAVPWPCTSAIVLGLAPRPTAAVR